MAVRPVLAWNLYEFPPIELFLLEEFKVQRGKWISLMMCMQLKHSSMPRKDVLLPFDENLRIWPLER